MNTDTTKTCQFCHETIPLAAKVCPRCCQWLTVWSFRNPVTWALIVGTVITGIFATLASKTLTHLDAIVNPRPFYSVTPEALRVLNSRMLWVDGTNGGTIFVVGMLTNQSSVAWQGVELQCRFFNANGAMIDAASPTAHLTILPGGDAAFRVIVAPASAKSDYHSVTVTVSSALNTLSRY